MAQNKNSTDEIDQKLGVLVEHMNDQFERVLEAVQSQTEGIIKEQRATNQKIDRISDYVEMTKADVKLQNIKIDSIQHKVSMLKVRSDQEKERLDKRIDELKAA